MSCLMLASCKQRLAQVGTCLTTGFGRSYGLVSATFTGSWHFKDSAFTSGESNHYGGGRKSLSKLGQSVRCVHSSVHTGPLLSTALVRRGRIVNQDPDEELRELVDEASGLKTKMEELQQNASGRTLITVPLHLEKRLIHKKWKEDRKWKIEERIIDQSRKGRKAQIIINCKRREFNHYHGQSYERNSEIPLASGKWKNRKSSGDHFTLFPGSKRQSPFMVGTEPMTFKDLGITETLSDNLTRLGVETPTHIQVFGIPQLLKGGYNVVAAETGCGKTLAYLLPVFHQLIEDKRLRVRQKPGQPSTVILVPSRELADQIYKIAVQLAANLNITIKLLQGGNLGSKLKNPPSATTVDILIATTNALKVLTSAGVYSTSKVAHVILDEADTLLDDSFFPELVGPFLNRLTWDDLTRPTQLTLVSATMPKGIDKTLGQILKVNDFHYCTTPGLHYSMPHVTQKFLRVMKAHKPDRIKELITFDVENKIPVLIFCNKSKTCDWLGHYLNDLGLDCASVHGRMPPKYRRGRIDAYQRGELNVLISTDLASRGIDTVRTQHVINYEFPMFIADYIHRCGRTGRVGSEKGCRVTNFVARPGEIDITQEIERSVRKEKALPDVDANIKRLYGQRYGQFVEIQPIQDDDEESRQIDTNNDEEESDSDSSDSEDENEKSEYRKRRFRK